MTLVFWYLVIGYIFALYCSLRLYPKYNKKFTGVHLICGVLFWLPLILHFLVFFQIRLAEELKKRIKVRKEEVNR